jgi:hypothetical protein
VNGNAFSKQSPRPRVRNLVRKSNSIRKYNLNCMRKIILLSWLLCLTLYGAGCKSAIEAEADAKFDEWFNKSFAKCGDDYFASFNNEVVSIYVSRFGMSANKGVIQFRNLKHNRLEDQPVTSTEKLNGIEWHGYWVLKPNQWRYYDGQKWSEWSDMLIVYSDNLSKSLNDLLDRPNSPMAVQFIRENGTWSGAHGFWTKPSCSEFPTL